MKKTLALICTALLLINMFSLPVVAAEKTPIEIVTDLLNSLPDDYVIGEGDTINKIEEIIIAEDINTNDLGTLKDKYLNHLNLHNSWKKTVNTQDRIKIDWQKINPLTCVDMFEYNSVEDVNDIKDKPGIVMTSKNNIHFPTTFPHGSFIGFYDTDSVMKNFPDTFPDTYGEYYITPDNGFQYAYSGISEKPGDVTYNAGIISSSHSYEINFDNITKYKQVSLLMSGIAYLSGEWARQAQVAKTTVFFADGTSKEQFHIVGPFCYSYRMSLYSTLEDKETLYSEFLGTDVLAKNLDRLWIPEEANVDSYFKIGDGRVVYSEKETLIRKIKSASDIGNATAITIDTDNKAIDKVLISYATVEEIQALGGVSYDTYTTKATPPEVKNCSDCYFIPINSNQLTSIKGYEANRNYYIGVVPKDIYPVYLHAVTGSKTTPTSYNTDIAELESKISAFPEEYNTSIYEELKAVKRRIEFLMSQGVAESDFDQSLLEKLYRLSEYNVGADGSYEVHVAPDGNDNGSGSKNDPLATLDGAKLFVRTLTKDRPINVIIHEGTYHLDETVEFTVYDSGTKDFPITYKADGKVIFTTADEVSFKDFSLVERGEESRIATDLIGKIYKIDLNKHKIYPGEVPEFSSIYVNGDGFDDVNFFVNNKEQLVAQWPDGESNYATWVSVESAAKENSVIKVDAFRSKKWQGEKHAYFEGYSGVDYSNERNNLTIDDDLIKFKNTTRFDTDASFSRRYKVKHLLSELDKPGEWYLDRDTNIFYYYPTEDFNENAKIQFSSKKLNTISVNATDYVNFDGLKFDKIRGDAFTAELGVEELNIYNCEFTHISNRALQYKATMNYSGSPLAHVANYNDAAKNCEVRNNRFINIGASAIYFAGGERETLSNGNNVIANNYVYNASNKQRCNANIVISGAYNYAVNNEAHMGTFHALNHGGNENVIAYNEFYNMLRDTGDCGVIYNGRQLSSRGTEIAYNYLHDYKHLDKRTKLSGVGVYLDDRLSGISIHHNILFANGIGESTSGIQNGGGHHNKVTYNTIIDTDASITRTNRFIEDYLNNEQCTAFNEIIRISGMDDTNQVLLDGGKYKTYDMIGRNDFFFERYPEMNDSIETLLNPNVTVPQFVEKYPFILTLPEFSEGGKYGNLAKDIEEGNDLTKYRILSLKSTLGNKYIGNIANTPWRAMDDEDVNGVVYDVYKEFGGVFENNVEDASTDMFVDYENEDFRIKGSTNGGALDESFNLDTIGLQEDGLVSYDLGFELNDVALKNAKALPAEYKEFNLTYPENNGRVKDKKNITFMWERPVSSDYFTLEVATDKEMKNIVYKNENSYFNFETVTSLPENVDTFYWRVTARNIGKDDGSEWQNADGVNVFHTYDTAIIEASASVPFDISGDFNADLFNDEGEIGNNIPLGGTNTTLGMYNLTNLKRLVPANGYYKHGDTLYYFPQVGYDTNTNNAINTQKKGSSKFTYTLKDNEKSNYDKIKVAISGSKHRENYEITVNYTDNTKTVGNVYLYQYYTTYNAPRGYDIILTVDGVNCLGQPVSRSNLNKIYEVTVDTDESKTVKSIQFQGPLYANATNAYIFAITGVKNERILENGDIEKPIVLNNYSGEEKNVSFVITGYDNGTFNTIVLTGKIANSTIYPTVTVTIPIEVYGWTDRQVFIWEGLGSMKPIGAKSSFFK